MGKKILEKSGNLFDPEKWEPCVQGSIYSARYLQQFVSVSPMRMLQLILQAICLTLLLCVNELLWSTMLSRFSEMSKELTRKKGAKRKGKKSADDDDSDSEDGMELSDEEVQHTNFFFKACLH